ncbi:MAG: hypothetical protein V4661_10330 [Pseudomonadota bacterium]
MPNRIDAPGVHLDHTHSEAVCQGIGEKMRETLKRDSQDISPHLRELIERLPELDRERAPSLVPSMNLLSETH